MPKLTKRKSRIPVPPRDYNFSSSKRRTESCQSRRREYNEIQTRAGTINFNELLPRIDAIVNEIQREYRSVPGLILTEDDLKCILYNKLTSQPGLSCRTRTRDRSIRASAVHAEVTWFDESWRLRIKPDLARNVPSNRKYEMTHHSKENALLELKSGPDIAVRNAVYLWACATTSEGSRKEDLMRNKQQTVINFFLFTGKHPSDVASMDIENWVTSLRQQELKPATVYNRACMISSFYSWAMRDPEIGKYIRSNPARLARPKAPKAYQTESTKALSDEELEALISVVQRKALAGNVVGKRDYAILLFFMATGMRRSEVINLRGRDLKIAEGIILTNRVKGGTYIGREISDPLVKEALIDYLTSCHRLTVLGTDAPLWTRHDFAGRSGAALSSHCFVKNMKRYAKQASIDHFHIHQTRHTFARIVAEDTGSIIATQDALDHRNPSTTRVYVQRIAIKRDQHSRRVSSRWHRSDRTND